MRQSLLDDGHIFQRGLNYLEVLLGLVLREPLLLVAGPLAVRLLLAVGHQVVQPEEVVLREDPGEVVHQLSQADERQNLSRKKKKVFHSPFIANFFCKASGTKSVFYHEWEDE